jgi:uncharacterized hydrophobic protein (TIGR00271 family)
MSVALLIPENWDTGLLVRWAVHFARAERTDLLILFVRRRAEHDDSQHLYPDADAAKESATAAIASALPEDFVWLTEDHPDLKTADEDRNDRAPRHLVRVLRITHSKPTKAILNELGDVTLLIVPRHASVRSRATEFEVERELFRDAPCRTLQLRPGSHSGERCERILVPTGSAQHSHLALELAAELTEVYGGEFTALFVEPEVDEVAELVGHRILDRIIRRALGNKNERLRKKVVLADDVAAGIRSVAEDSFDLIITSADYHGRVHRFLFRGVTEQLISAQDTPPVAAIRRAIPLTNRFSRWLTEGAHSLVPQLDREHRIALVERIQANSKWDFDFIALTCLSTLIAAMGLLQNSAAVVIGAMLVAPLMTPLLGAGLSVVQGNRILLKNAVGSVLRGFLLAFAIGLFVGLAMRLGTPAPAPSQEMLSRGSPGILDLLVALISGIAAAYAVGRPNLLSALPGVAIAAALVPPIATAGLATALGLPWLAIGAALLFLTNIVAIILGTSLSLWLVGIRSTHEHGPFEKWSQWMAAALVVAAIGLAAYESRLPDATWSVTPAIKGHLQQATTYRFVATHIDRRDIQPRLRVVVEGPSAAAPDLVKEIAMIAKRNGLNDDFTVEIETRIVTNGGDPPTDLTNDVDSNAVTPEGGLWSGRRQNPSQQ